MVKRDGVRDYVCRPRMAFFPFIFIRLRWKGEGCLVEGVSGGYERGRGAKRDGKARDYFSFFPIAMT